MTKIEIEKHYEELCKTPSDINEHLPMLRHYADRCEHVTEFGVRSAVSLYAFLSSNAKKVVAVDIIEAYRPPEIDKLEFICGSTLEIEIEQTDFLFIDTLHTYTQLKKELERHAGKVNKWIGCHDTGFYGRTSEDGTAPGLLQAINEFLGLNKNFRLIYQTEINNGLTILGRV